MTWVFVIHFLLVSGQPLDLTYTTQFPSEAACQAAVPGALTSFQNAIKIAPDEVKNGKVQSYECVKAED